MRAAGLTTVKLRAFTASFGVAGGYRAGNTRPLISLISC
jgi:hypothetical protein